MTIEEIEELIRKYLSTGIAVVVILIAPGTATGGGSPEVITIDPGTRSDTGSSSSTTSPPTRPGGTTNSSGTGTGRSGSTSSGSTTTRPGTTNNGTGNNGTGSSGTGSSGSTTKPDTGTGTTTRPGSTGNSNSGTGSSSSTTKPDTGTGTTTRPGSTTNDNRTGSSGTGSNATAPGDDRTGSTSDSTRPNGSSGTTGTRPGGTATDSNRSSGTGSSSTTPGNRAGTGSTRPRTGTGSGGQQNEGNDQSANGNENAINDGEQRSSDNSGDGVTAAEKFGWGRPNRSDDFTDGVGQWNIYDGPGHAGQGTRSPSAVSTEGGILTITGDSSGTTAGMAWNPGQKYGRWEGRVRAPASDPSYNALLLLWPDAEDFPVGGEIDFMEMMDPSRQRTNLFLHYGESNEQVEGQVEIDATQWHNWALEWTPDAITAYVDGEEWWRTTDTSIFPPGPMHLCIQLDWFPEGDNPRESTMEVDWVRQYSLDKVETSSPEESTTPVRNVIRKMFSWR